MSEPSLTATPPSHADSARPASEWNRIAAAILVLLFITLGHLWSINTGLFLDDHAHYAHLREAPWTIQGLVEASRLGIVGDVMDLWGRQEAGLRFFRPVAFGIMKLEYTLVGWRPMPMHILSLAWHFLCAMLVGELAFTCLGRRFWAAVAAALMAIHPGHVATVYWIACQTELMATAFLLIAALAYARYAHWQAPLFLETPRASDMWSDRSAVPTPLTTRVFRGFIAVACYALALGCRENAVLFPLICLAGDRLLVPRGQRRRRVVPLLMFGVLGAYFALRHHYLGGFQMPARPYIYPPGDPGFIPYVIEKIVYYTIGLFGFVPVIPMGGQAYFASRPLAFYGGFAGSVAILVIIWAAYRFRRALLWPAIWIACAIAPVIPVFASSHHLYLPGVGAVLLLAAGLAALGGLTRRPAASLPRSEGLTGSAPAGEGRFAATSAIPMPQRIVCGVVLLLHAVGLSLFTWGQGFAFRAGTLTEDIFIREVLERSGPIREGDHFFFINMPVLAYYAIPALESQLGWTQHPESTGRHSSLMTHDSSLHSAPGTQPSALKRLHGHVLTFSPWLMRMEKPGSLEILDAHRLRVRAPDDARYFEGVTGRTLLTAMGLPESLPVNQPIRDNQSGFTVTPVEADDRGVREFLFEFDRPITSRDYHFVFGSPHFLAYPLSWPR